MIALFHQMGGPECFPVQMISQRWIPNFDEIVMPALRIKENNHIFRAGSAAGTDSNSEGPPAIVDGDDEESQPVPKSQGRTEGKFEKYKRLFYFGKEIAQKGSRTSDRYDGIVHAFRQIPDSLCEEMDGEVRDAVGRPRGRARGRGHSHPESTATKHCPLCDSRTHDLLDCRHDEVFRSE
jgi:hypothetical protein